MMPQIALQYFDPMHKSQRIFGKNSESKSYNLENWWGTIKLADN